MREYLDGVTDAGEGAAGFEARVARNALAVVERELRFGPALARAHAARLAELGFDDDAALAAALRAGTLDDDWDRVAPALAASARDQLRGGQPLLLAARERVGRRHRDLGLGAERRVGHLGARRCRCPGGRHRPAGSRPS